MAESRLREFTHRTSRRAWYGAVTFLSAFLLFQVQLIAAKAVLPWFGGTASVWTTAVFFFQSVLLVGYGYSHLTGKLGPANRFRLHAALLGLSLLVLGAAALRWPTPITPSAPALFSPETPATSLLATLLLSVGLPFALLSTTSPLLQDWFAQAEGTTPYWLYAISNAGSLAGLLSYPFLVEPLSTLQVQSWSWAVAYLVFAAGTLVCGLQALRQRQAAPSGKVPKDAPAPRVPAARVVLWIALAAAGSSLFLATTNYLTQDVASVPLLWVCPLALYLLSFVLTFGREGLYRRLVAYPLLAAGLAISALTLFRDIASFVVRNELWIGCAVVLVGTFFCHGELARLKPKPQYLTWFYFCVALGGALGSLFVAVIAPRVFPDVWEYHISLVAVALLAVVVVWSDALQQRPWVVPALALALGLGPLILAIDITPILPPRERYLHFGLAAAWALLAAALLARRWPFSSVVARHAVVASALVAPLVFAAVLSDQARFRRGPVLLRERNFYGVLTVYDQDRADPLLHRYELYNGRILHGLQLRDPQNRHRASTYYGNLSGAGVALRFHPRRYNPDPQQQGLRVGIVGMGTGTLLIYETPADYFRVYEVNPAVVQLSRGSDPYFSYLRDARGPADVVLGDARISLQREADAGNLQKFDVLVLDAFSSDSIPVHLLTREAFRLYQRHLRDDDSMIAVHITNYTLDLAPVVARLASDAGLYGMHVFQEARGNYVQPTDWILLSKKDITLRVPEMPTRVTPLEAEKVGPLWTDSFSNLFSLLK